MTCVYLVKTYAVLLQFVINVRHCSNQCQFLLQKLLGPNRVNSCILQRWQVSHILQEVQFLSDVIIDFLFGLEPASDEQVGAAEQANCDPKFKLIEYLLCNLHVCTL